MKSIYLAIWYQCNQKCRGCPCALNDNRGGRLDPEQIRDFLEENGSDEPLCVTLSGGEPTLHPQFFDILDELASRNAEVVILTNSERFADRSFADGFLKHISLRHSRVITTIHSSRPEIHESQNGAPGSFEKTLKGLNYLFLRGVNITVKHCVTGVNYKDTADFIRFVDDNFHPQVDLQLFGIDYCGLTAGDAAALYVPFTEMRPWLEEGLDVYLERSAFNGRRISVRNIPLCAADPYYWELMYKDDRETGYSGYMDPTHASGGAGDNAGTDPVHCADCCVREACQGTYRTVFDYFGADPVCPVHPVE